jgi:hypothetical protein
MEDLEGGGVFKAGPLDQISGQVIEAESNRIFFTIKAKAMSGVILLVSNFALRQDTKLSTNTINK